MILQALVLKAAMVLLGVFNNFSHSVSAQTWIKIFIPATTRNNAGLYFSGSRLLFRWFLQYSSTDLQCIDDYCDKTRLYRFCKRLHFWDNF